MAEQNVGKVTQIISAVLDIKFSQGKLPKINEAIRIKTQDGTTLTAEVAQQDVYKRQRQTQDQKPYFQTGIRA